jgi:ribose transport system substrate-binding protein
MKTPLKRKNILALIGLLVFFAFPLCANAASQKIAYLVSDLRIPFWQIMARGIESKAEKLGYELLTYSAENNAKKELENTIQAISKKVDGIIVSPTNSSACATILKLAKKADIPVVISDIGTESGEYVSYISSDNTQGAYEIGKILSATMKAMDYQTGSVGIIGIPQKRANGKARTAGFVRALDEAGIKSADLRQQVDFSYEETYKHAKELISAHPELKAIWLQGSDRYQAALDVIEDTGNKGKILLICFDAEPEFIELINNKTLVGAAMQQPFLMGSESLSRLDMHLNGKVVEKNLKLPVLAISHHNIQEQLNLIKRNVLGILSE